MKTVHKETPIAKNKEVVHDETPAIITDHKFSPKGEWWSLCKHCNLSEAAHAATELQYYSDNNPD